MCIDPASLSIDIMPQQYYQFLCHVISSSLSSIKSQSSESFVIMPPPWVTSLLFIAFQGLNLCGWPHIGWRWTIQLCQQYNTIAWWKHFRNPYQQPFLIMLSSFISTKAPGLTFSSMVCHFFWVCSVGRYLFIHLFQNCLSMAFIYLHCFLLSKLVCAVFENESLPLLYFPIKKWFGVSAFMSSQLWLKYVNGWLLTMVSISVNTAWSC